MSGACGSLTAARDALQETLPHAAEELWHRLISAVEQYKLERNQKHCRGLNLEPTVIDCSRMAPVVMDLLLQLIENYSLAANDRVQSDVWTGPGNSPLHTQGRLMDERCKTCPWICKRLDPDDQPARYFFARLRPEHVITLIERVVRDYAGWHSIQVEEAEGSRGEKAASMLQVKYMPTPAKLEGISLTVLAHAESHGEAPTEVWFRYGVPEPCCDQPQVVSELTALVEDALETLSNCDSFMQEHRT